MSSDCYKVEVLHFLNPHLIWVEVSKPSSVKDDFNFEQLGIYGLLPHEIILDTATQSMESQKCRDWVPATKLLMKEFISTADEVWFCPVHIDRRSSIFDDNIHKYGELIIKTNGVKTKISKFLINTGFAAYDECSFHQQLHSGKLNTKLTIDKKKEVVKQLELFYTKKKHSKKQFEKSMDKQAKIFHAAQHIESALTVKNLQMHNRKKFVNPKDRAEILKNKLKDLEMCKDVEEESIGRATQRRLEKSEIKNTSNLSSILNPETEAVDAASNERFDENSENKSDNAEISTKKSSLLLRKLTPHSHLEDTNTPLGMYLATKKYLKENATTKSTLNKDSDEKCPENNVRLKEKSEEVVQKLVEYEIKEVPISSEIQIEIIKKRRPKKVKAKIDDLDGKSCVAYGPPEVNRSKLVRVFKHDISHQDKAIEETKQDTYWDDNNVCHHKEEIYSPENKGVEHKEKKSYEDKQMNSRQEQRNTPKRKLVTELTTEVELKAEIKAARKAIGLSSLQKKLAKHKMCDAITVKKVEEPVQYLNVNENKNIIVSVNEDEDDDDDYYAKDFFPDLDSSEGSGNVSSITPRKIHFSSTNVNPFKNTDRFTSVFVDKMLTPVLMVHSKMNKRFEPSFLLRDIHFNSHIQKVLRNMSIERSMVIQTLSWFAILRGFSLIMIGPKDCGKTMGYLPAVCRLVTDSYEVQGAGPIAIIVCATAASVSQVETLGRMFFGGKERVVAFYTGMNDLDLATSLLNGCDLLICTPVLLCRLLRTTDFSIDLRRLTTLVFDDCERLGDVYLKELNFINTQVKEMLKSRSAKELEVQYILSSRMWCNFMRPLAKKAPNTVICISAFQECVLYSKAQTTASFITKDKKIKSVLEFLKTVDIKKRTVIVCRSSSEVDALEKALKEVQYPVLPCKDPTVQDLYHFHLQLESFSDPFYGPIVICCDSSLMKLNITDAHNLIHFSLPEMYSLFCKRFSVLNDNYASIFREENESVKIKIMLEEDNVEQLPKILHFIKRCTTKVPEVLDEICQKVLANKDAQKAVSLVPVCDNLLALGECPDVWKCQERHTVVKGIDKPKEWVPTNGVITFKILHYHSATRYSARLMTHTSEGKTSKYPQTFSTLTMKLSMYFSTESNKRLHGEPFIGDICAVSVKQSFFARCQVLKILNHYRNGKPNSVLIRLIDEEKLERTRDIRLFYLPDEMKNVETHVVEVRLANIQPKDKDVTFSNLATEELMKITETDDDMYLRGHVALTIGSCVLLDTLETCKDLSSLNKTVVRHDFKEVLKTYATENPNHLNKLEELCKANGMIIEKKLEQPIAKFVKEKPKIQWAHLDDDMNEVIFAYAIDPGTFFVRLNKFDTTANILSKEIQNYVTDNFEPIKGIREGNIVLARYSGDDMFDRARIDMILENGKIKCFFVDQGDWGIVERSDLREIPDKFITQLPFQAIECRLYGVKPAGDEWTEFATNWFVNNFETEEDIDYKINYARYFSKEISMYTGGHKYGVVIIDTTTNSDKNLNKLICEHNLAKEIAEGMLTAINAATDSETQNETTSESDWEKLSDVLSQKSESNKPKLLRSIPLVDEDIDDDNWDCVFSTEEINTTLNSLKPEISSKFSVPTKTEPKAIKDKTGPTIQPNLMTKTSSRDSSTSKSSCAPNSSHTSSQNSASKQLKGLDSDDLSSSDSTILSEKVSGSSEITNLTSNKSVSTILLDQLATKITPEKAKLSSPKTKSTNLSEKLLTSRTSLAKFVEPTYHAVVDPKPVAPPFSEIHLLRKPTLLWRQNKTTVTIKIQVLGIADYKIAIMDRAINFTAIANDVNYGFVIQLYGIVEKQNDKYAYSNKGQYFVINLSKVLHKNWLSLTRDGGVKKWILYDVDAISVSSDEDDDVAGKDDFARMLIKEYKETCDDSESDDGYAIV